MSKTRCVYVPKKGAKQFMELRKNFGYARARDIFLRATHPNFLNDYKDTLTLDSEGVPTIDSIMNNSFMKEYIGKEETRTALENTFKDRTETRDNYKDLLTEAYSFNTSNENNKDFVAVVESKGKDKIGIVLKTKDEANLKQFKDQYSSSLLNDRIVQALSSLGVNISNLTEAEVGAGRVGVTDFSVVKGIGTSAVNVIQVANNIEGDKAISEEFSHLVVGIYRNEPLVQRAINSLQNNQEAMENILGDEYEDTVEFHDGDMSLVAEEALGKVLQKNLLGNSEQIETPTPSLFQRLFKWIINKFKGIDSGTLTDAINEAENFLSPLANKILNKELDVTDRIRNSERNIRFNALSEKIDRNIGILKQSLNTELKRKKIYNPEDWQDVIYDIEDSINDTENTALGIFNYAKGALQSLRKLEKGFTSYDTKEMQDKFKFLRGVQSFTQSYGTFIQNVRQALIEDSQNEGEGTLLQDFEVDGTNISIREVIRDLNDLSENLTSRYYTEAIKAFSMVLEPFLGKEVTMKYGQLAGQTITVEKLLQEAPNDIGLIDRWLQALGDSNDVILQGFNAIIEDAETKTRLESIDFLNKCHVFREHAENLGITDFEWMFEHDSDGNKTGNYIGPVNYGQFDIDMKNFFAELDEKYGKNPVGEDAKKRIAEKEQWLTSHASFVPEVGWMADAELYKNEDFDSLTDNQKTLRMEFLKLKGEADMLYPTDKIEHMKAIQDRKSRADRFWESASSPTTLYSNVKEAVKNSILSSEDDDQLFGERASRSLVGFDGHEFKMLPILYTSRLRNPNEISDDIIGSLMAYGYSAIQYKNMSDIVDALEVGKSLVAKRKPHAVKGDKKVIERFRQMGHQVTNDVFDESSNAYDKLVDIMDARVYHRYIKDEGDVTIFGKDVSKGKVASTILKWNSLARMGFNFLGNIANIGTGIAMTNIEAAAGQYVNASTLFKADGVFFGNLLDRIGESGKRSKTNKLSLASQLFNFRQNFEKDTKRAQTKNWLRRLFGAEIAYLGQDLGDDWLYTRVGIAMLLKEQVLYKGEQMSLWDALEVRDVEGSETVKKLNIDEITDLNGNALNIDDISHRIMKCNEKCFGIYNDEHANAANRVALGRLAQQFRKWMTVQYSHRFRGGHPDVRNKAWEEGYYRTFARLMKESLRGGFQFKANFDNMTTEEQSNVKRAIFELFQFMCVLALVKLVNWPDDKDRPWAMKLAEYVAKRELHELGGLTPSVIPGTLYMPQEILKTVKTPIPSITFASDLFTLANSLVTPSDYMNEIKSGPYKGLSNVEKNIIKAPIPGLAQVRQISKFTKDIDDSIMYYMRPSN